MRISDHLFAKRAIFIEQKQHISLSYKISEPEAKEIRRIRENPP